MKTRFFALLLYALIRLFGLTWRIRVSVPADTPTPDRNASQQIIFAFWHNRLLVHTFYYRHCRITAMISKSRDGELIAQVARMFGHRAVRGSSSRDSGKALARMIELLKQGNNVTLTPDGPQGPRYALQPGVIEMARASGATIVPMSYSASSKYEFKSWDRFVLPLPFSKIDIHFGKAMPIPHTLSPEEFEEHRQNVERELLRITDDHFFESPQHGRQA